MKRLWPAVLIVLVACSPAATPTPEAPTPEPSVQAAAGIERLCQAFDIVNDEISEAYEELAGDTSFVGLATASLAIVTAGANIQELAEGVEPEELAEAIRTMGQHYIDEADRVSDGDLTDTTAVTYYLDLVEEYGSQC